MQKRSTVLSFWHLPRFLSPIFAALVISTCSVVVPSTVDAQQYFTIPANALEDDAPETLRISADVGDLVSIDPSSVEDARTQWSLRDSFKQYQIDPQSRCLYIAVPRQEVEILLIIAPNDIDKRIQIRRFLITTASPTPVPDEEDDSPAPEPTPEPSGEYDGPNEYGIGEIAYRAALEVSGDRRKMALGILETGRDSIQGKSGAVLFIDSQDPERNVFDWIALSSPEWIDPLITAMKELRSPEMRLKDWINVFDEAIAGVKGADQ